MNRRLFPWLIGLSLVFFVVAPILIVRAPLEQEMGLIQKIFYFHFSAWMAMYLSICVLGISSAQFLFRRKPAADRLAVSAAEAAIVFGLGFATVLTLLVTPASLMLRANVQGWSKYLADKRLTAAPVAAPR